MIGAQCFEFQEALKKLSLTKDMRKLIVCQFEVQLNKLFNCIQDYEDSDVQQVEPLQKV